MFNSNEKELLMTIIADFLKNKETDYKTFKAIEKIIEKLSKED